MNRPRACIYIYVMLIFFLFVYVYVFDLLAVGNYIIILDYVSVEFSDENHARITGNAISFTRRRRQTSGTYISPPCV